MLICIITLIPVVRTLPAFSCQSSQNCLANSVVQLGWDWRPKGSKHLRSHKARRKQSSYVYPPLGSILVVLKCYEQSAGSLESQDPPPEHQYLQVWLGIRMGHFNKHQRQCRCRWSRARLETHHPRHTEESQQNHRIFCGFCFCTHVHCWSRTYLAFVTSTIERTTKSLVLLLPQS